MVNLPKWPQLRLSGRSIRPVQALEIIRRTDTFITCGYSGNNREYAKEVRKMIGMPPDYYDMTQKERDSISFEEQFAKMQQFRKEWNCVDTSYIHNSWVQSAYIFGPYGWCHPDGTLYFSRNIGKWPSQENIQEDLTIIATAFPFLVMDIQVMDGEEYEDGVRSPLLAFKVREGKVIQLDDPNDVTLFTEVPAWAPQPNPFDQTSSLSSIFTGRREEGLSLEQIRSWIKK